ncbi:MAG: site-specific DNA-methyltransferase [Helicobacteraceae bacterium]|jgi:DNA modification methylase|nr:site-specific DNA-methyltransferase [Helicobacteraceae bacterium]
MNAADSQNSLLNIKEASLWASSFLGKNVTASNIAYLIQYGRVRKIVENGATLIALDELKSYYNSYKNSRENFFKDKLGGDLNWILSFEQYKEAETTKHIHRLHPYKGKFIPQLAEYFLCDRTDNLKREIYFKKGDIVLDPFCGSGTTLAQANELYIHAIGVDISEFNALISNCKIAKYDIALLQSKITKITKDLEVFVRDSNATQFEAKLAEELKSFNDKYFPAQEYKYLVRTGEIDEIKYGAEKEKEFLPIYENLTRKYNIKLRQEKSETFLDKWYSKHIRDEIDFVNAKIQEIDDGNTRNIISVILSRAIRSCRATTHADLATLIEPATTTYYCAKHGKICKPIFSIVKWWKTYCKDTILRLAEFDKLRTDTYQICFAGDSKNIDIFNCVKTQNKEFYELLQKQKIKGIFSSPPYVGLIDYHEQHAYAYDLFAFERKDALEIGSLSNGQTREARQNYVEGVAAVLNNCKRFLADNYDVFLVANDKHNIYPAIAEKANMEIANRFNRPVLNRSEKDKTAYSETIFHLKEKYGAD